MLVSIDFALRVRRRYHAHGSQIFEQTAPVVAVRKSSSFKLFIFSLIVATLCISARCAFRVAELSGGWTGPLMRNQTLFIVFEGIMIFVAAALLAAFNPGFCFKQMSAGTGQVVDLRKI